MKKSTRMTLAFIRGMLGCLCMGGVDWLMIYAVLSAGKVVLPEGASRIGFTNGLMSESVIVWFCMMLGCNLKIFSKRGALDEIF